MPCTSLCVSGAAQGIGLVWRIARSGVPMYERKLASAEVRARIDRASAILTQPFGYTAEVESLIERGEKDARRWLARAPQKSPQALWLAGKLAGYKRSGNSEVIIKTYTVG